jgi:hypothetical protein
VTLESAVEGAARFACRESPFDSAQGRRGGCLYMSRCGYRHMSCGEPREEASLEFFGCRAEGAAVIGSGNLPENCARIASCEAEGVAKGNVAIHLAVNEKNGNVGGSEGIFGRDLLHVEVILQADVEESEFDDGAEESASEPGTEVKGLAHAVIGDLTEGGERRFGDDGAEVRFDGQRLQKFGGAHGLAESEDATWVGLGGEEVEPLVNVVALEKAVGSELASADAVAPSIREQDGEAVSEEELGVSGHADAVIGEAVEKKDSVVVAAAERADEPGAESDRVRRGDPNIFEGGIELAGEVAHGGFVFLG